jgi:hypothetical protein
MDLITKLRYQGYAATPPLWKNTIVSKFKQIELNSEPQNFDGSIVFKNQRLGKLVEEFVFNQLQQEDSVYWICDNLQIQNGKQTVGEIDALYYEENQPVHLEIVYKYYLYDAIENYNQPLAYWIGPNRKDSLLYKLDKLHTKQLPLLYNELTKPYLKTYDLDIKTIEQQLCFKAQLFLPYHNRTIDISPLNPDCIAGFYIAFSKIEIFVNLEFYIPKKLDWLVVPYQNVTWMTYTSVLTTIESEINNKRSPLVWLRHRDTELTKCFITFW